jgi:hypothetical protein
MRRRLILVLVVLALVAAVSACGDGGSVFEGSTTTKAGSTTTSGVSTTGGGSSTTGGESSTTFGGGSATAFSGLLSSALAAGSGGTGTGAVPGDEEACVTAGLQAAFGEARFAELDAAATAATDFSEVFSLMTEGEISSLIDVTLSCVDVKAMLATEMESSGLTPEGADCFATALSEGDTLKSLLQAMIAGGADATASPEFLAIMIPIFTTTCADAVRTMLVDQFTTMGISPSGAACIADTFMSGGLFEAILNSMVGGADPTSDPEFANQMATAFTDCLTPEELANLGIVTP